MSNRPLLLGAVAYDPKVVTIWDGFQAYFIERGLPFDYILYTNYERQVEALFRGHIDVAWNSPLAWIQAERVAKAAGRRAEAICMRDSDCELTSVVAVKADSPIRTLDDLRGRRVAVGAADSPQATLIPLYYLSQKGLEPHRDFEVVEFDMHRGKHGDHIGGERDAIRSVVSGICDAACILDANHLLFAQDGTVAPGATRIVAQTPAYDHCNFTTFDSATTNTALAQFRSLLLGMSYADARVRRLLYLEGLKRWVPGTTHGYQQLAAAVDHFGSLEPFLAEAKQWK
jgi:ABC-type phosphate/phosphonate transport system substrate-binding protein